jgi:hypothetical protein
VFAEEEAAAGVSNRNPGVQGLPQKFSVHWNRFELLRMQCKGSRMV